MRAQDVVRLLSLAALWGGSFAFIRVAAPALGPIWLAESRVALAFAALFAVAAIGRRVPSLAAHWREYLVIGTVNSALPFALFGFAEQTISASNAAILNATSPFFGAIIAAAWLGEPLGARKVTGMALGLAGVVLLVGWQSASLSAAAIAASLACLFAALCYGIGSNYAKVRLTGIPTFAIAVYSQLAAAVVLTPALPFVPPPLLLTPAVAANVLALALASTAIAYLLYFRLIADIGPERALTVTFLIPLFGVLWGVLFLREPLSINMLSGGALILAGTWLAVRAPRRDRTVTRERRATES
jgi:drug/metabolite transporter (DMT)-like permease